LFIFKNNISVVPAGIVIEKAQEEILRAGTGAGAGG